MGEGQPEAVEVVQPQGQVMAVLFRYLPQTMDKTFPKHEVFGLGLGLAGGFAIPGLYREDGFRRQRLEGVAIIRPHPRPTPRFALPPPGEGSFAAPRLKARRMCSSKVHCRVV